MSPIASRRGSVAWLAAAAALAAVMMAASSASADTASAAREMSRKWGDAVVTVKVVMKMRWVEEGRQADESENTTEANGTVIDPSGLVVCSLSMVDPSQRMDEAGEGVKLETEVTDLKIISPDGKEIKAKVVLRDKDLDLAFIHPSEKLAQPMVCLDLTQDAQPDVLDEVVIFSRMSQTGNRTNMVAIDRITAVIEKPRRVYVTGMNAYLCGLGCPALSPEGKVVGVLFMRSAPPGATSGRQSGSLPVVLPSAQILSVAGQAPKE